MVNKRIISLNVFFSLFQILVTGLAYYFLYKYLLNSVGPELMGVWAIVLSISSTANVANLGIGASVVRYTATYKAKDEMYNINKLVHTSSLFLGAVFLIIILIVYLIAPFWLHAIISNKYYANAMELVPFSLLCLFFNAMAGVFLSCIDGLQKNYLRSLLYIISFAFLIAMSYIYVPKYGLIGVAYAQLWQAGFLLVSSIISLKFVLKEFNFFAFGWDKTIFKKIFSFGIQEQIISICQLCFDPFTKSMLGSFGSLQMVTYYEMANRLVVQLRGFLVSANQVFIPVFAGFHEKSKDGTQRLYGQVFSINFLLSILWVSFIIASVVPVSIIWIRQINNPFIVITVLLAFAYLTNIIMSPAYFANMGSARLKENVIGNIIIGILNVVLCLTLGLFFNGYGVITGWSVALAVGSLYILLKYHKEYNLHIKTLLTRKDMIICITGIFYGAGSFLFFYNNSYLNVWLMFGIDIFIFLLVCALVYKIHPVSKTLLNIIKKQK